MRDPEYDRFGPWVIEISEEDPPPPLFLPYLTREETPLLSIKIPRKIERRDASPGMNLYDYMVTLYEDDLVILQRVDNDVRSFVFLYRDVKYIRLEEDLLKGSLFLAMPDELFMLPFNTVSRDVIRPLVDLIRQRYSDGAGQAPIGEENAVVQGELSYYFTRLLAKELAQNPQICSLAVQANTAVGSYESGTFRKLMFGMISKTLLESIHLGDGREMKIISRGKTFKYKWQTAHATETTFVPTANISGITWQADPGNEAVVTLTLDTPGGSVSYAFMHDNPSLPSYERYLTAVLGSEAAAQMPQPVTLT